MTRSHEYNPETLSLAHQISQDDFSLAPAPGATHSPVSNPFSPPDAFFPSTIPDITNIPQPSTLGGVRPILAQAAAVFAAAAGNSNPVFRFAMCDWVLGMLGSANNIVESAMQDPSLRDTPVGREAVALNGMIKGLIGLVKSMFADKTETIKGNKEIAKGFQGLGERA